MFIAPLKPSLTSNHTGISGFFQKFPDPKRPRSSKDDNLPRPSKRSTLKGTPNKSKKETLYCKDSDDKVSVRKSDHATSIP